MPIKLLDPKELKTVKDKEVARDIGRVETVRTALKQAQKDLDDTNARFESALASQRIVWDREEKNHEEKLSKLLDDIIKQGTVYDRLLIPIEDLKKKAQDMFSLAEKVLTEANEKNNQASELQAENERSAELLSEKLDGISEYEQSIKSREDAVQVKELTNAMERENIRKLSQELLDKLNKL